MVPVRSRAVTSVDGNESTARHRLRDAVAAQVRPETEFERSLIDWVVRWDEYGVCGRRFAPGDVVLDVGAHIGVFSVLVHLLGSRAIHAFEPDPANHERLERVVGDLDGVTVDPSAVFRSDLAGASQRLVISGGTEENTGESTAIFGGRTFRVHAQEVGEWPSGAGGSRVVDAVSLDEVLDRFDRVTLLKLDCEGSEFPILLTSRSLDRVDEIVGEYHVVSAAAARELDPQARVGTIDSFRPEWLAVRLQSLGFGVHLKPYDPTIGWFRAVRS
jgi:FkbM family methyltransferase